MFAVAYDAAPNGAPVAVAFAAFVALLVVAPVVSALSPRLAALCRAASAVEVRPPAVCAAWGLSVRVRAAWLSECASAWWACRSDRAFRAACLRRAASEVHSGQTLLEEWGEVLAEDVRCGYVPACVRLQLREEMRRFRPSEKAVKRARSLRGKPRLWRKFLKVSKEG